MQPGLPLLPRGDLGSGSRDGRPKTFFDLYIFPSPARGGEDPPQKSASTAASSFCCTSKSADRWLAGMTRPVSAAFAITSVLTIVLEQAAVAVRIDPWP